jgi:predicted nucleic acid-binding protein
MLPGSNIIILDTSCLILLSKINELGLLKQLSEKVYITSIIRKEYGKDIPAWIEIVDPSDKYYQAILEMDLDKGEASSIALSLEVENGILIIDDLKGRKVAEKLRLKYSGTFGMILKAKQVGIIKTVKPILDKVRSTDFRYSEDLFQTMMRVAGE